MNSILLLYIDSLSGAITSQNKRGRKLGNIVSNQQIRNLLKCIKTSPDGSLIKIGLCRLLSALLIQNKNLFISVFKNILNKEKLLELFLNRHKMIIMGRIAYGSGNCSTLLVRNFR
jgi:hypothetical protein